MAKKDIFGISEEDQKKYQKTLFEYFTLFKGVDGKEAQEKANELYEKLISGTQIQGHDLSKVEFFDERLEIVTEHYYIPTATYRSKYPKGSKKSSNKPVQGNDSSKQRAQVEHIKANLLAEYPALNRKDLQESVENYCTLQVQLQELLAKNKIADNHLAIKNITHTMVQLGSYLGIDEGAKAKQKDAEDTQSVAALAKQFEQTLKDFPEIHDRMRYKEIRICLEKYDRQEISREIFASRSWADMSVEDAREFVRQREQEYEAS